MSNPATTWISEAHKGGYLRAAFIDCQLAEYNQERHPYFIQAQKLASGLRPYKILISHFMLDSYSATISEPFQYKDKNKKRTPNENTDFKIVVPEPEEWVYPKSVMNGFDHPHAAKILETDQDNEETVLICAGFNSLDCLRKTVTGSFNAVNDPTKHKVVIAHNATNLTTSPEEYLSLVRFMLFGDIAGDINLIEQLANNIELMATDDILDCLKVENQNCAGPA